MDSKFQNVSWRNDKNPVHWDIPEAPSSTRDNCWMRRERLHTIEHLPSCILSNHQTVETIKKQPLRSSYIITLIEERPRQAKKLVLSSSRDNCQIKREKLHTIEHLPLCIPLNYQTAKTIVKQTPRSSHAILLIEEKPGLATRLA